MIVTVAYTYSLNVLYFVHRRENRDFLEAALDEASKRKRKREDLIGIQMTVLSWSVECIFGGLVLVVVLFGLSGKETWERDITKGNITSAIVMLFCTIIIPGTYLLKTENMKNKVFNKGWSESLRECFHLSTNRVVPIENIQMNPIPNMPPAPNLIPGAVPISIISENNQAR